MLVFRSHGTPAESVTTTPPEPGTTRADIKTTVREVFRDNAERAEELARALSTTVNRGIEQLENERRNEPEWQAEIDFLKVVSATLEQIADAISQARQAATPQIREQKFVEAETLASSFSKAMQNFAERNYERVLDFGGYLVLTMLGTQLFTTCLGVPPEEALATQLVLLGLGRPKK